MKQYSKEEAWLAFAYAQESAKNLSKQEKARIQAYTRENTLNLAARTATLESPEYWQVRIDAASILHMHLNPIVRHEAAFALGAFTYQNKYEQDAAVKNLRWAMRTDRSIVARHEAIEALGSSNTFCMRSISAAADMCKINYLWPDYHDVAATAQESFSAILTWLKKDEKHTKIIRNLESWWELPRLAIPRNVLIGSRDEAWLMYMQNRKIGEKTI